MVAIIALATTFLLTAISVNAQIPGDIPSSCQGACKPIVDKFSSNNIASCATDAKCFCSNDVVKGLSDCYKCAAGHIDKKMIDDTLQGYADGCKALGSPVDLNAITSSGGNGGKTGDASSLQFSSFAAAVALGGLALL